MLKTQDSKSFKRVGGKLGDRLPSVALKNPSVALYTATGGETSVNLQSLNPPLSYQPGLNQIHVVRGGGQKQFVGVGFFETNGTTISFPAADPLDANELVEFEVYPAPTGYVALPAAVYSYDLILTAGQQNFTVTVPDFSWQYLLNQTKKQGAIRVFLDGQRLNRGDHYLETAPVSGSMTNQLSVTLPTPAVGGEVFSIEPFANGVIDVSQAANSFTGLQVGQVQAAISAGTFGFIDQSALISVPNTAIVGRAQIPNIAADLKASMGITRIPTQQVFPIQNEFGANGEQVFGLLNDANNLVRFVGAWTNIVDSFGERINSSASTTDYVEITFYGTGLNVLHVTGFAYDLRASVDGGSEGGNIFPSGQANLLNARNYAMNCPIAVTSGLTLGIHTVKLRNNASAAAAIYGFEVVNSSGNVAVNPGAAYISGTKINPLSAQPFAYGSIVTGTTGGRVLTYLNSTGTIGQAFTACAVSPSNFSTSVPHTNEIPSRIYNFREFGTGRSDDFSFLNSTSATAVFTLDDGTTTLTGTLVNTQGVPGSIILGNGGTLVLTFVGTGLDLYTLGNGAPGVTDPHTVSIDGGSSVGNLATLASTTNKTLKVVSGLPYGTHTVTITRTSASLDAICFAGFQIYAPSLPALPVGAIQLADYFVMANFVVASSATNASIANGLTSTGVLRKFGLREVVYTGTGWALSSDTSAINMTRIQTGTTGDAASYTFFGTGFDLRYWLASNNATSVTISVDGSTNLSGFTSVVYGGTSFTAATGVLNSANSGLAGTGGLAISNLSLGTHTVKVTYTSGGVALRVDAFDIITPIHSPVSDVFGDLQNTLPIGSCGIADGRKTVWSKAVVPGTKAWAQAVGVTSTPTTSVNLFLPVPDMSLTLKTNGGPLDLKYWIAVSNGTTGAGIDCQIYVDGVAVPATFSAANEYVSTYNIQLSGGCILPVAAGVHKVDLYWIGSAGSTTTADGTFRTLVAREI